jgi:hypothetical protein
VLSLAAWCLPGIAVAVVIRWMAHRTDPLGRRRPFPAISFALCLLLGAGAAVPVLRHHLLERRLSAAASTLTPFPVRIRCQTASGTLLDAHGDLGHVRADADGIPEHEALVKYDPCGDVASWLGSGSGAATPDQVVAVHVLTHETMHMLGETDEAKTECLAVQRDQAMARALGASPQAAAALARRYWTVVYPRMPDDYRSSQCGPGEEWDERRSGAPWAQPSR